MNVLDLRHLSSDELLAAPSLYILGVNGPLDEAGVGRVDRFVWRFAVLDEPGVDEPGVDEPGDAISGRVKQAPLAFAFTAMPILMRFTRRVNSLQPFTAPTEALRVRLRAAHGGLPIRIAVDADGDDFCSLAGERRLVERVIPELEF